MRHAVAAAAVMLLLCAGVAAAECRRCGSRFACVGDSAAKLALQCGEPLHRAPAGSPLRSSVEKVSYREGNLLHTFVVEDGVVVRIEQEFVTE